MVIAGPCSAESPEQVMKTARALSDAGIGIFRAGIWKPRSHPGTFEGAGEPALEWLKQVQITLGMKVCCEVASAAHVQSCLACGIDMLWIGARTTANPFMVQEIAEALRGSDVPVLVKNPVSPDLELWRGAFERLRACGISRLYGILRGVTASESVVYRNDPAWELAISLRGCMPEIPLLCDPSHIAGKVRYVPELSRRALNLGFDGLMIESHCNPAAALSDAGQQMTAEELKQMLQSLTADGDPSEDAAYREALEMLRAQIDVIDDEILALLARRMDVSSKIGTLKRGRGIAIVQPDRWNAVLSSMIGKGRDAGLPESFVRAVFSAIHSASVAAQDK